MLPARRAFWLAQLIGWGTYAVLFWLFFIPLAGEGQLLSHFVVKVNMAATGFVASLALWALYDRILPKKPPMAALCAVAAAASLFMGAVWLAGYRLLTDFEVLSSKDFLKGGVTYGITLLAWSALYLTSAFHREAEVERELALRATALASQAQLAMLRYQVNPHFLFNALNSIRALVDENPSRAREMVTELSEFFRYSLLFTKTEETKLGDELDAIRNYLAIQSIRFEEKLEVSLTIEPEALEAKVPGFLVHPLVENAVKYGMETSAMPLVLTIEASRRGDALRVVVSNSGRWKEPRPGGTNGTGTGTGLANVRARLLQLYPDRHRLEIEERGDQVCALLELTLAEPS